MNLPSREPAFLIGVIAAVVLAVVQTLVGQGILAPNIADTIAKAIDPNQGGWLLPIALGLITRFFVYSPASVQAITDTAAATGNPVVPPPPAQP